MSGCFTLPTPANCGFFEPVEIEDEFSGSSRRCFFFEDKGKDAGFPRWRVCFYYESHKAMIKFFESQKLKDEFLGGLEMLKLEATK